MATVVYVSKKLLDDARVKIKKKDATFTHDDVQLLMHPQLAADGEVLVPVVLEHTQTGPIIDNGFQPKAMIEVFLQARSRLLLNPDGLSLPHPITAKGWRVIFGVSA